MTPDIIKLVSSVIVIAIGAAVATIWTPVEADAVLLTLAGTILAAVWVKRPGDTAP